MIKGTITKTGNSYAIRVPMHYITDNNLKQGDIVMLEEPKHKQDAALAALLAKGKQAGSIKAIPDPVAWQRAGRRSTDPWT